MNSKGSTAITPNNGTTDETRTKRSLGAQTAGSSHWIHLREVLYRDVLGHDFHLLPHGSKGTAWDACDERMYVGHLDANGVR